MTAHELGRMLLNGHDDLVVVVYDGAYHAVTGTLDGNSLTFDHYWGDFKARAQPGPGVPDNTDIVEIEYDYSR